MLKSTIFLLGHIGSQGKGTKKRNFERRGNEGGVVKMRGNMLGNSKTILLRYVRTFSEMSKYYQVKKKRGTDSFHRHVVGFYSRYEVCTENRKKVPEHFAQQVNKTQLDRASN